MAARVVGQQLPHQLRRRPTLSPAAGSSPAEREWTEPRWVAVNASVRDPVMSLLGTKRQPADTMRVRRLSHPEFDELQNPGLGLLRRHVPERRSPKPRFPQPPLHLCPLPPLKRALSEGERALDGAAGEDGVERRRHEFLRAVS